MGGERRTSSPQPPDPETTTGTDSAKDDDKQSGLNAVQIAAATGASTTAAVVANLLGVYGTVIGVAVISVVSSVATVLYLKSINGTKKRLRKVVRAANQPAEAATEPDTALRADSPGRTVTATAKVDAGTTEILPTLADPDAVAVLPATTDATTILPTVTHSPATGRARVPTEVVDAPAPVEEALVPWWNRYGKTMALSSLVVFVLSIVVLSGIALLSGQDANTFYQTSPPAESGNENQEQQQEIDTGTVEPTDDESPTPSEDPSSAPDETPSQKPSDKPSTEPTDPEDPTTDAPTSPVETPSQTGEPGDGAGDEPA